MAEDKKLSSQSINSNNGYGSIKNIHVNSDECKKFFGITAEQASTVLIAILNKQVSVTVNEVSSGGTSLIKEPFKVNSLMIKLGFSQGINGPIYFIFTKKDVAVLADLMMMGDGSAEYEEDFKDAVSELSNQIFGALCSTLGVRYGITVTHDQASVSEFNAETSKITFNESVTCEFNLNIREVRETRFLLVMPFETASSIGEAMQSATAKEKEEAKPKAAKRSQEEQIKEDEQKILPQFEEEDLAGKSQIIGGGKALFSTTGNVN
ncbi:MAG: chemotaxis protein CheX, partial [Elusimicrobiota bacterium]